MDLIEFGLLVVLKNFIKIEILYVLNIEIIL